MPSRRFFLAFLAVSAASASAAAQQLVVFDASRDCSAVMTSTGLRYAPPCHPPASELTLTPAPLPAALASLPLRTVLDQRFSCSSLRPIAGEYTLGDAGSATSRALAPTEHAPREAVDGWFAPEFRFTGLLGLATLQAFKPGCQWQVERFVSYASPSHAALLAQSYLQLDSALAALSGVLTPDAESLRARSAIESTRSFLGFLLLSSGGRDELLDQSLELAIQELGDAGAALSQSCGAGSAAQLCSAAMGSARDQLQLLADDNLHTLLALAGVVEEAMATLEPHASAFGAELSQLVAVRTQLAQRLR